MQYCSLQHWILLMSPVPSTTGYCFCFGSIPSFFVELFIHWSPVAYWTPTNLGSFSFSILPFCFSYCSWGSQGKNTEVFCHSLLQWITFWQTSPPWPNHLGWPHMAWLSFTELDTTVVLWADWLVLCDYGFSLSALWCPLAIPTICLMSGAAAEIASPHPKSGTVAERSNPTSKEWWLRRRRRAERSYSTFKVRRAGHEENPRSR